MTNKSRVNSGEVEPLFAMTLDLPVTILSIFMSKGVINLPLLGQIKWEKHRAFPLNPYWMESPGMRIQYVHVATVIIRIEQ